jgi:2-keto-3-deoxy-L-rhamnonate aldolase RhmA
MSVGLLITRLGGGDKFHMRTELGVWNVLPDQNSTFQLPEYFDFIYIDLEHGLRTIDELLTTIRFFNLRQTNYSVRVRRFDDPLIQTLLDAGVRNFILPQLRSINEFSIFKSKISFPPNGTRGLHPKSKLKINTALSEKLSLTVIIETPEALEILDEIASDASVTDLYLGVFDLSMELGIQGGPFSPEVDKYYLKIMNICKKFGKNFVAMLPDSADLSFAEKHSLDKVVIGIDSMLIHSHFLQITSKLRTKLYGQ